VDINIIFLYLYVDINSVVDIVCEETEGGLMRLVVYELLAF